jgi:hypothetical protein
LTLIKEKNNADQLFLHELNLKPFINKTLKLNKIYFNIGVLNVQRCKKKKVSGYSKLCKQELVKLLKKTLNNKKGGGGNNNNNQSTSGNNNNNQSTSRNLKNKVREKTAEFQKYLIDKLNDHQIKRIMFLLDNCLHPAILKNQIANKRKHLEDTIYGDIRRELDDVKNPKREEIINKIVEFVNDILSSHANYRLSLVTSV